MKTLAVLAIALAGCASVGPSPAQAQQALENWAAFVTDAPAHAIVFVGDLTQGGGWDGPGADDAKIAFMSGAMEATVQLPDQEPPPGDVIWGDGKREQVSLISAATSFAAMVAEQTAAGGKCTGCRALQVTGAELTMRSAITSHGEASVPVWQFAFGPGEEPLDPISYVAVRDQIAAQDWPARSDHAPLIEAGYGNPTDARITIAFIGGACDDSHSIVAAESTLAIAPIITTVVRPGPCTAQGVVYGLALQLASPLGSRVVLDDSGFPVAVYPEEPPTLQPG